MIGKMFEILLFLILGFFILYLLSTRFRAYINALFGQWLMRKLMKRMQNDMNRSYNTNDTNKREEANNQKRNNHNEKLDPSDIVKKKLNNKSQDQYVDFEEIK